MGGKIRREFYRQENNCRHQMKVQGQFSTQSFYLAQITNKSTAWDPWTGGVASGISGEQRKMLVVEKGKWISCRVFIGNWGTAVDWCL